MKAPNANELPKCPGTGFRLDRIVRSLTGSVPKTALLDTCTNARMRECPDARMLECPDARMLEYVDVNIAKGKVEHCRSCDLVLVFTH